MAQPSRSISTVLAGLLFAALLGGSAIAAFKAGNELIGVLFCAVALVALAAAFRRPPQEGPSLRTNVLWSGLGFLVVGAAMVALAVLDDRPALVVAGLGGVMFLGLAVLSGVSLWKLPTTEEPGTEHARQTGN